MFGDLGEPLPDEERDKLIEQIAQNIHRRGLETPAILFLEMHKPLSFFVSQTLIVTTPLIAPVVGFDRMAAASRLLESRDNVELLIERLEELAAQRSSSPATTGKEDSA